MTPGQTPNLPSLSAAHQELAGPPGENGGRDGQQGLADVRRRAGLVMPPGAGGHGAGVESAGAGAGAAASGIERRAAVAIVTPGDVRNRQFSSTRLRPGYDEQEVDAFLDEVEAELDRLRHDNRELELRLAGARPDARGADAALSAHAAGARAGGEAAADSSPATGIRALAQHVADQAIAAARRDAAETIAGARRRAGEIVQTATRKASHAVNDATAQAERLEQGARERHRQATGSLGPLREELKARVDYLRAFEREYRAKLKAYLEGHLREIQAGADDSGDVPAVSAAGPQPPVGAGMDHAEPRDTGQATPPTASVSGAQISPPLQRPTETA